MHSQESGILAKWCFNKELNAQLIGAKLRLSLRKYRNKEFDVYLCVRMLRCGIQCFSKPMLNSLDTIRGSQHRTYNVGYAYQIFINVNKKQLSRMSCKNRPNKADENASLDTALHMQSGTSFSFDNFRSYLKLYRRILKWKTLPPPYLLGSEMI